MASRSTAADYLAAVEARLLVETLKLVPAPDHCHPAARVSDRAGVTLAAVELLHGMAEAIGLVHDRGDRTTVCHSLEDSSTRPARWLGMRRLVPQQVTFWPELIGHQTKNLVLCRRPVESTMILDGRTGHAGSSIYHGVLPTTGRTPCKNCWTPSSNA